MPTPAPLQLKPLTAWSFSRYGDYKKCPAFFKYKHLMGMKEPGNAAMQRGSDIHKLAEDYAKGLIKALPKELSLFKEEFADLRKQKVKFIEESWTWTQNWAAETTFNDWSGAWLRVKLDAAYLNVKANALVVIDHKTGKLNDYRKGEYEEQLELYALAGLVKFPDVAIVSPRLWYLDAGAIYPNGTEAQPEKEFTRADEPRLRKIWLKRIEPMFKDKTCKPVPSAECQWCFFRKSNNGPCQY
jgi:PD-(D/E)XK nuclease superfamily